MGPLLAPEYAAPPRRLCPRIPFIASVANRGRIAGPIPLPSAIASPFVATSRKTYPCRAHTHTAHWQRTLANHRTPLDSTRPCHMPESLHDRPGALRLSAYYAARLLGLPVEQLAALPCALQPLTPVEQTVRAAGESLPPPPALGGREHVTVPARSKNGGTAREQTGRPRASNPTPTRRQMGGCVRRGTHMLVMKKTEMAPM